MGKGGSSKSVVEKVHPYTTGRNWETVKRGAKAYWKEKFTVRGDLDVTFLGNPDVDLKESTYGSIRRLHRWQNRDDRIEEELWAA